MRTVSPIRSPIRDEHVIEVDPPLRPELPGEWRRRINPFTGRALSDKALTAEQDFRSGVQRLRGQELTGGTVFGLDLQLEPGAAGAAPADARFQLLPGLGLTQWGEDVVVSTPRRLALGDLPVYARADQLDAILSDAADLPGDPTGAQQPDPDAPVGGIFARLRPRLPRRIGPSFSDLLKHPLANGLPRAAVLVAEPVTATILGRPDDGCPHDPRDDPYDDLQLIDGCRLTLFFWPSEMTAMVGSTDYSLPGLGADYRNKLAYRVFNVERLALPGEFHPWERRGVPLALIGFKADWSLDFIDKGAVSRIGGQPNPRTPLVTGSGAALLWQARLAQFVEHFGELDDQSAGALAAALRQLPPIGFLPRSVISLDTRRQTFFPPGFRLSASPIPLEHIDAAVRDSASLIPLNLDTPDTVELLVPVPERVYEPGLLEVATIDPVFDQAIARYVADRARWLIRRELVRRRRDLLVDGATGHRPSWPASDLPANETLPYPTHRGPVTCTRIRAMTATANQNRAYASTGGASLEVGKGDRLYFWVRIADPANLTGISIQLGVSDGTPKGSDLAFFSFWGAPDGMVVGSVANNAQFRRGDLPPAGIWTRLEVPALATWKVGGINLVGAKVNGVLATQRGGSVEYGPIGKITAAGDETVYIGDDLPPGSDPIGPDGNFWPFKPASPLEADIVEADFGTVESGGIRTIAAVTDFRARWTQPFLAGHFALLDEAGLDGFIADLDSRLKSTNDAIDLGFVRARADIYRVRTYMLGQDAASRLVTSPALADLAIREEGARAKALDLAAFVKTAYQTDFTRDPDAPLETRPKRAAGVAASPPPPPPASSGTFNTGFSLNLVRGFVVSPPPPPPPAFAAILVQPRATVSPTLAAATVAPSISGPALAAPSGGFGQIATLQTFQTFQTGSTFSVAAVAANRINFTDVQGQLALPGRVERTASVAERLKPSPVVEAHAFALDGKLTVISTLAGLMTPASSAPSGQARALGIALADLPAPGFRFKPTTAPPAPRVKDTLGDLIEDRKKADAAREYEDADDLPAAAARHEADYFNAAVRAIDNTIALMRLVEARVELYQTLISDARDVRQALNGSIGATEARLRTINVEVEEARHDVGVAEALLAEETARVGALNAKRARILADHVKVVLFRRPRRVNGGDPAPTAPASAALIESPITACLREHDEVPEELREYAALFRDAPVSWFPAVAGQLRLIDRLESARLALASVRLRASSFVVAPAPAPAQSAPKLLAAVNAALAAQRVALDARRVGALQLDLGIVASLGLAQAHQQLTDRASLGDLIAGDHNRPALARLAAQEVDQIGQVAACLHASFGDTPPATRLGWAEILSEFDQPAPLRRLSGLPGWNELPLELKRTQQGFVDFLFSRVDSGVTPATQAINELVRVCILMASQAPVDRIIPARLVAPSRAELGARLDLAVDIAHVRIGMVALVRGEDSKPVAQAVIEDISDGLARARITQAFVAVGGIGANARIELGAARRVF